MFDLGAAVVWSSPEELALFAKVAKFVVCRNVSYDSLLLINAATRLH